MSLTGGLLSAVSYGVGDCFCGLACRRDHPLRVLALTHPLAALCLGGLALGLGQVAPPATDALWGVAAGLVGLMTSLVFWRALAVGPMGVVSVAAGSFSAGVPVLFGVAGGEVLGPLGWWGALAIMVGMACLSFTPGKLALGGSGVHLGVLAGLGMGFTAVLLAQTSGVGVLWMLALARLASSLVAVPLAAGLVGLRAQSPRMVLAAMPGDTFGNVFYLLAVHGSGLALGSLLSSLYPAFTALLAVTWLRERLLGRQWLGISVSLFGAALLLSR